jgi:putative oxidoreductase
VDLAGWIYRAGVAVFFVIAGWGKFDSAPSGMWVKIFAAIGFGQWFRIATGVVEVLGGVLYLFPQTCKAGAVMLGAAMLGAIVAHLTVLHDPIAIIIPGALLAIVAGIALRDPNLDLIATHYRRRGPFS